MFRTLLCLLLVSLSVGLAAQMTGPGGAVRYGNEWIDYGVDYVRIAVAEDGVYRVSPQQLRAAGLSFDPTGNFKLERDGEVVPAVMDENGLTFYGEQNRGDLDKHLFENPEETQLNDRYSMYNDTAVYFLSSAEGGAVYRTASVAAGEPVSTITRSSQIVFSDNYSKTFFRTSGISIYYSTYDMAEGFGRLSGNELLSSNDRTERVFDIDLPEAVAGSATLDMRYGLGFDAHIQDIQINGRNVDKFEGRLWSVQQMAATFTTDGTSAEVKLIGSAGDRDKANVAWAEVRYPARPTLAGLRSFIVPASAQNVRVRLEDAGAAAGAVELVNPATGSRVVGENQGGAVIFNLPAGGQEQRYHVVSSTTLLSAPAVDRMSFKSQLPAGERVDYVILTSSRLNGPSLDRLVAYRSSPAGGNYNVLTINVEDLYDEFGYGVNRHPIALRNYLAQLRADQPRLQYLFLIGKGREYDDIRTAEQLAEARSTFFVPSFGFPASDNLLTAPIGEVVPALSTGRLAAISDEEIGVYLGKLRAVEAQTDLGDQTIADRAWMKQMLHLGGGTSAAEQRTIRNNLNQLKQTIETSRLGGNVASFFKTSSEPIETSQQDAIFDIINGGTSIITFYGHSSSSGFEFNIDNPDNYENAGRYPYMLSLGCYSGDAFTAERSISERFIFLPNKGAIAFAASKGVGFISSLRTWGDTLYAHTGGAYYGQGVGDVLRATIESFSGSSAFTTRLLTQQFALSGDPAYRLHPRPGPDLVVDPASVSFSPEVIPAQQNNYAITYRVVNLGRGGGRDSITVSFDQELPSGEVRRIGTRRILAPHYDATVTTTLPNIGLEAVGRNRIRVRVDSEQELAELPAPAAENNNDLVIGGRAGVEVTVIANTARVAYPPEFAVVSNDVELFASTTSALAPEREYLLQVSDEIDFADLLHDERIVASGGIIRSTPPLDYRDSTTYYWRISPDSTFTEGSGYIWSTSSFTFIDDRAGQTAEWAQQHPGQFTRGSFDNIRADSLVEGWDFTQTVTEVTVFNGTYESRTFPRFMRDNQRLGSPFPWSIRSGMSVLVIDSTNFTKWLSNPGQGDYNTRPVVTDPWSFATHTQAGRQGMMDFLREAVPEGSYVIIWSLHRGSNTQTYYNDGWLEDETELGTTLFDALEGEGALEIRRLVNSGSVPYGLAFQKGLGLISEVIAEDPQDQIELRVPVRSNWERGGWTSAPVGPATAWSSLEVQLGPASIEAADSIHLLVNGLNTVTGDTTELRSLDFPLTQGLTYEIDISDIDAEQYPKLFATLELYDDDLRTAPTVRGVYFDYSAVGDVAVSPAVAYSVPDSIQAGQPGVVSIGFENISRTDMDSLLVELQVVDRRNNLIQRLKRTAPVAAGSTGSVDFELATETSLGDFRIRAVLNPDQDQPEEVIFNNVLTTGVQVGRDDIDPVVLVYFDGQQIFDGDLVSGRPEIRIQMRDENRFLALDDTSAYEIRLQAPDGSSEALSFADDRVEFLPASVQENTAEIIFRPELLQDGRYSLTVAGKDRSDNASGRYAYQRNFEVVNQMKISNVLTYPNPFTTETRFVYTLTGSEQPSTFRIQILTVSGRVVRDIDLLATETLKIGTHRTDFVWDGTDEYGDLLANGVYLYRVITADNSGSVIEKHDTGTDQYFDKGFGKVVILR